jgi:imidazole glycerol phosphate synthase glutamine amidotransferase subunit
MAGVDVAVVRTGTANLASVLAGLRRAGGAPRFCAGPRDVHEAARVVLPGVGTVAAAMERLEAEGLAGPLRERVQEGRPTLAVCLGLQLLCAASEESPGVAALGVIDGRVERFSARVRVPHLGWNRIVPDPGCRLLEAGHVYFANSYRLVERPAGWSAAACDYDGPFVAALERGDVLACQFHPELSGRVGLDLLARWLATAGRTAGGEVSPC